LCLLCCLLQARRQLKAVQPLFHCSLATLVRGADQVNLSLQLQVT
jgi:hypothetical protein